MDTNGTRLLIITTAHNQAAYIERTIRSIVAQTVIPAQWVVVDQGSTDETAAIVSHYADFYPWIKLVRQQAGMTVDAFHVGLEAAEIQEYDYICKIDADVELAADYFATLFRQFDANPRLGVATDQHTSPVAQTKSTARVYRAECFADLGGFVRTGRCRDGELTADFLFGWESMDLNTPVVTVQATVERQASLTETCRNFYYRGRGMKFAKVHWLWMLCRVARQAFAAPGPHASLMTLMGYMASTLWPVTNGGIDRQSMPLHLPNTEPTSRAGGSPIARLPRRRLATNRVLTPAQ